MMLLTNPPPKKLHAFRPGRVALFKEYQRTTSLLIPLPRRPISTSGGRSTTDGIGGDGRESAALLQSQGNPTDEATSRAERE